MKEDQALYQTSTIAEMTNGIILANFEKTSRIQEAAYQSEAELEKEMIANLVDQGYEYLKVQTNEDLYRNLKIQLEKLNQISFNESEWRRFLAEYLDVPSEGMIEKNRKVQEKHNNDFTFDY